MEPIVQPFEGVLGYCGTHWRRPTGIATVAVIHIVFVHRVVGVVQTVGRPTDHVVSGFTRGVCVVIHPLKGHVHVSAICFVIGRVLVGFHKLTKHLSRHTFAQFGRGVLRVPHILHLVDGIGARQCGARTGHVRDKRVVEPAGGVVAPS